MNNQRKNKKYYRPTLLFVFEANILQTYINFEKEIMFKYFFIFRAGM